MYGSTVTPTWGTNTQFAATCVSNTVTVTVGDTGGSCTCSLQFNVLAPQSESAVIYQSNLLSYPDGLPIPAGIQGASMQLYPITVYPTNVSFANVQCAEEYCPATDVWGYFTNKAGPTYRRGVGPIGC